MKSDKRLVRQLRALQIDGKPRFYIRCLRDLDTAVLERLVADAGTEAQTVWIASALASR